MLKVGLEAKNDVKITWPQNYNLIQNNNIIFLF